MPVRGPPPALPPSTTPLASVSGQGTRPKGSGILAGATTADGHTYDKAYKKWEKFDVDAALDEADEEQVAAAAPAKGMGGPADAEAEEDENVPRINGAKMTMARTPATIVDEVVPKTRAASAARVPRPKPAAQVRANG